MILLMIGTGTGLHAQTGYKDPDPLCGMIRNLFSLEALRFKCRSSIKNVFETDTSRADAEVIVRKTGNAVDFLQIIPEEGDKELLFCHDSVWIVDHTRKQLACIGKSPDDASYSNMGQFFSFTLFNIDTAICHTDPFWQVIARDENHTTIALNIAETAKEVSDVRVEFSVYNSSWLPYKTVQESTYLNADKLFQEQIFTGYSFPDPLNISIPEYFFNYSKNLDVIREREGYAADTVPANRAEIFLKPLNLKDLSNLPVRLPETGLIFLDFWYVGCSPCMRSAPIIEKLYNEYNGKIHFYSVNESDQDTGRISLFIRKMGITFPVLLNDSEKIAERISGTNAYPQFVLMEADTGRVLWNFTGFTDKLEELIIEIFRQYL